MGDTILTPEKRLTFSDAMRLTLAVSKLSWKVLVASQRAWWSGGGTVSIQAIPARNGSADTGSEKLVMRYPKGTITVTVTGALRHVTPK